MSYNRSTQAPCSATCCAPKTFLPSTHNWAQSSSGTQYNQDATKGVYDNSLSISANLGIEVPSECSGGSGGCDTTISDVDYSYSARYDSDAASCAKPVFEPDCCHGEPGNASINCEIDQSASPYSCSGSGCGGDWTCMSGGGNDRSAGVCLTTSMIESYSECFDGSPPCSGGCGFITLDGECGSGTQHSCITYGQIIDTTWYASGLKIKGTPDTFVGYPATTDPCDPLAKGLRRIFAKCLGSVIFIKWEIELEWDGGTANQVNQDTFSSTGNSMQDWEDAMNANIDVGIQGSGGSDLLIAGFRLGNGSDWYDITNTEVEFYYQQPRAYTVKTGIRIDWYCGNSAYCCDDNCTCSYTGWDFVSSATRRITTSSQVLDESGNCIWDAHPSNWGSMICDSADGISIVAGSTCTIS